MVIIKELGLNFCENPWQDSFIVDKLTDIVEEAVYKEFEAISERGGVLGAMDTMYHRSKLQEECLYYEHKKHDGCLPKEQRQHRHRDRADPLHGRGEGAADCECAGVSGQPQRVCGGRATWAAGDVTGAPKCV